MLNSELYSEENYSDDYAKGDSLEGNQGLPMKCELCKKDLSSPVVLNCLHVFDRDCLSEYELKSDDLFSITKCPKCNQTSGSLANLESFNLDIIAKHEENDSSDTNGEIQVLVKCSLCTDDVVALYKCADCIGTLCQRCRDVHKVMKMFSSHSVTELSEADKVELSKQATLNKPIMCSYHRSEAYRYFCFQCHIPICLSCASTDHKLHINCNLEDVPAKLEEVITSLVTSCQTKQTDLKEVCETLNNMLMDLGTSRDQNRSHINEVCNDWKAAIDEIKEEFMKKNKEIHDDLEMRLLDNMTLTERTIDHIDYAVEFTNDYLNRCSPAEMAKIVKAVIDRLEQLSKFVVDTTTSTRVRFDDDRQHIRDVVRREFGWFGTERPLSADLSAMQLHAANVATSTALATLSASDHTGPVGDMMNGLGLISLRGDSVMMEPGFQSLAQRGIRPIQDSPTDSQGSSSLGLTLNNGLDNALVTSLNSPVLDFSGGSTTSNVLYSHKSFMSLGGLEAASLLNGGGCRSTTPGMGPVLEHSISLDPSMLSMGGNGGIPPPIRGANGCIVNQPLAKPGSQAGYNPNPNPPFPNRSGLCSPMNVRYRWGSLGSGRGQLSSPHGFCLGFDEEIVVADTQNHRIQVFDKLGEFRNQFGVPGREEGQLWYPRKVAAMRSSQKYVVCDRGNERSRMQIFTRSGHFIKKIAIRYIDIVAGLAINAYGHIVAVDSVSPTVFVISENGDLIKWFDCSDYMREPSDIAISGREYYICDFKGHCVAVFQEDGTFIRRIGCETITNFPNGIDVSDHGDVLIGDSHGNRFHIAVYTRQGVLQSEFECGGIKVSRCCGLKITSEGYVVTLAKNNHHVLVLDTLYVI